MSRTVHRGGYVIKSRPYEVSDDDWDIIFKREKQNTEKSRYKRGQKHKDKD